MMHVHLIFVTKYRGKIFTAETLDAVKQIFSDVCTSFEASLVEFKGERDHVHLLVEYHPKISVSTLVNSLKGVSSRHLRNRYPSIAKNYYKGVLWSPSYFAGSCGGAPLDVIKQYIEQQDRPY